MALGDICRRGDDWAYSKFDGSMIYKGQWNITIDWTGSYNSGQAFSVGTASRNYSTPQTFASWWLGESEGGGLFNLYWYAEDHNYAWVYGDSYPLVKHNVCFHRSNWSSYGGGYMVSGWENASGEPMDTYSLVYAHANSTIADVVVTVGYV
jgi:hypothetical protein